MLQDAQGYPPIWELASGFGGGIGRKQDVCGAITGAVIAIGYQAAQGRTNRQEISGAARTASKKIYEDFEKEFGAVDCRTITGCDFCDPAEYQRFHDSPGRAEKCHPCVEWAIRAYLANKE